MGSTRTSLLAVLHVCAVLSGACASARLLLLTRNHALTAVKERACISMKRAALLVHVELCQRLVWEECGPGGADCTLVRGVRVLWWCGAVLRRARA